MHGKTLIESKMHDEKMAGRDAVQIAPHVYKVVLENEHVRVLDTRTGPGDSSEMNSHPNMVGYAISDCTWDLTGPDDTTVLVAVNVGETFSLDAVDHSAHDVGTTGSHALLIELNK